MAEINDNSEVFVEDQLIGRLEGFSFKLAESASFEEGKALKSTALAVLGPKALFVFRHGFYITQ